MRVALVGAELEENLALRSIHAALAEAGHEARVADFHAPDQIAAVAAEIAAWAPDVVGLSMVFTARAREFLELATALRAQGYTGHITAGGPFASLHAPKLLERCPDLDTVLHGEGEEALVELLARLDALDEVRGLTRRLDDGACVVSERRPLPGDLDARPWPTRPERFDAYQGLPIANLLSGRGCYAHCHFCSIDAWTRFTGGVRFRQRKVGPLADEMAWLYHARGVRLFNFHDDNFFHPRHADNLARFSELKRRLDDAGVGRVGLQVKARPDSIDEATVAALLELGVFRVFLGVESNSARGLEALGRGITPPQNHRALALLKAAGLHVTFNLLAFEPDCTLSDLRENAAFMREQAEVPFNFCRTEVYGGTPLEQRLAAQGRLVGDVFGYEYAIADPLAQRAWEMTRAVFTPRNFTLEGAHHRTMGVEYEWKILEHFRPRAASTGLGARVKGFVRDVNLDSAARLERILDAAAGPGPKAEVTAELAAGLLEAEGRFQLRAAALLREIHHAAQKEPLGKRLARAAAGAATAALLLGTACQERLTHATEMAAAPPVPMGPRPCTGSELRRVETAANRLVGQQLEAIVAKEGPFGADRVEVRLTLDADGSVAKADVRLPPEKRAHAGGLDALLRTLRVPDAGNTTCAIILAVASAHDAGTERPLHKLVPPTHFSEMAPLPPLKTE